MRRRPKRSRPKGKLDSGHLMKVRKILDTIRIAGLLIIYYGATVKELRYLKISDLNNGSIRLKNEMIRLEGPAP